jgi:hypothetical protein
MSTESKQVQPATPVDPIPAPPPEHPAAEVAAAQGKSVLRAEAEVELARAVAEAEVSPAQAPVPLPPGAPRLEGRSFVKWVWSGIGRFFYRSWTRLAVRLFPEDSRRAELATHVGVPLPDRLNLSWITPSLAVGGRVRSGDIARLRKIGVMAVVDTRAEHKDDEAGLAAQGIKLLYLPTPDTYPLTLEQLREGSQWINQQVDDKHRVLVHCEHGVGRSVLMAAAALVGSGIPPQAAVDLVQEKRWQAAPNRRQLARLQEFAHTLGEK